MKATEIMFYAPIEEADQKEVNKIVSAIYETGKFETPILVSQTFGIIVYGTNQFEALKKIEKNDFDFNFNALGDEVAINVDNALEEYCKKNNCTAYDADFEAIAKEVLG